MGEVASLEPREFALPGLRDRGVKEANSQPKLELRHVHKANND